MILSTVWEHLRTLGGPSKAISETCGEPSGSHIKKVMLKMRTTARIVDILTFCVCLREILFHKLLC